MKPILAEALPQIVTPLPGPLSEAAAQTLHALEAAGISAIEKGAKPVFWERASGAMVEDIDGNRFLDCTSSFGVAGIGHRHPRVQEAITNQSDSLIYTMPGINPHSAYVEVLKAIVDVVGRWDNSQVLLTNTGSEAIEVALKLSLRYTEKPGIIAFQGAFHGQSLGALAATSHNELRDPFNAILSQHIMPVPYPNPYRPAFKATATSVADACLDYIEHLLRGKRVGGSPIGSILIEPMQNASGYIVPPEGFLRDLRALCTSNDVLLILDEIFTGFGRTGYWLASDSESVIADIVCVGKTMTGGVPSAACLADRTTMTALSHNGIVPLHSSTFVSNPIACTAATATINVLRDENLIERARTLGDNLRAKIIERCDNYPFVGEIRGLGAAIAIEFVKDKATKDRDTTTTWAVMEELLSRGIVTLVTGLPYGNVLAICPPFVITDQQCDYMLEALVSSMDSVQKKSL